MILNHFSNRLHPDYYETVIEMLVVNLGFVILRRTAHAIWLRQPGANVDAQFVQSAEAHRDADKRYSQMSFISETPREDLEKLAAWAKGKGMEAVVGSYSDREFFLDAPAAFVDFIIEAMRPELADYGIDLQGNRIEA
ncbi:hypothetical protein BH11PSE3_BH11PSE3_12470 [soil metagenome]